MNSLIRLERVNKVYKMDSVEVVALQDINFEVKKGDFIAILGPSGSGKSTLLNILGVLDKPSSGKVYLEDKEVSKLSEKELAKIRNEKIGFVFQFFNLYAALTALENVELPMIFKNIPKKQREERARHLLKKVGLEAREKHYPAQLSGGERQRVAIARALANDPPIILADEPTGNLDSKSGKEIMDLFKKIYKEGKTIIIITHDPEIANKAKKKMFLKDGKIVKDHALEEKIVWGERK
ncbi:MAG: ABC transporter ATP-binding protein [archaeon]